MRGLSILAFIIFISFSGLAQPGDPAGGVKPDTSVPLSGIEILIGIGSLFGVKKIYESRKNKK